MGNHETRGVKETAVRREKENDCFRSSFLEPLKRAVANFRKAATRMDQVIHSSDLANET